MDTEDGPPGAEGYHDTVTEKPKKPDDEGACTKAEAEFKEHLNSLKIKVDDGTTRCMVERRGRDVAGKWIYLCYPCAAVCSGETILQTHIIGKKHKTKLTLKNVWPVSIFEEHPYIRNEKGEDSEKKKNDGGCSEQTLQKMADVVSIHNMDVSSLDRKYSQFRSQRAAIQTTFDDLKVPLLGVEYLVELEPDEPHYEPSYTCVLCNKQGAPRTIVNHMVSYWHRIHYLWRHFPTTHQMLQPYRNISKYRDGVGIIMNRLVHRIEESYGRLNPIVVEKDRFNREKEQITQWIFKGYHFSEKTGQTFAEVVDTDLITSLGRSDQGDEQSQPSKKDPSPPVVHPPIRPDRCQRRGSVDELSDDLGKLDERFSRDRYRRSPRRDLVYGSRDVRDRGPHPQRFRPRSNSRDREKERERRAMADRTSKYESSKSGKPGNLEYKLKMAEEQSTQAEQAAAKILAYHEKNPEKHPLYPEEWKKFWNKRYKELQAEAKDPSKHDFKPEWIVFWTKRMKELHEEELKREIVEVHRRLNLPPPEDRSRRSPPPRTRSPIRRRSRSPGFRHRSPRRRSPVRFGRRSRSPVRRSRSPIYRNQSPGPRRYAEPKENPYVWRREEHKKSLSPLSLREAQMRAKSLTRAQSRNSTARSLRRSPSPVPDTVMISDDEFKVDPHSPIGSVSSLGSLPDAKSPTMSHTGSAHSSRPRPVSRDYRAASPMRRDDSADDVVSSLRMMVALEDYLGSLGPKLIDLLALALKLEKEKPNSSEQLLENELSVNLIEMTKEKLKGAIQAGLIAVGAVAAARKAVTKAASLLHESDKRQRKKKAEASKNEALPIDGVGAVDKAAIAKQMAAALIAQGKTDVTQEELAQLVDAVVGMAEAKKREVAEKAAAAAKAAAAKPLFAATAPTVATAEKPSSSSGSALQLLQSAYDENEKKAEKEETDVMDGLSDSDLKTLLQNFSELSAEEQHGLIAYLKKLEAKDPQRVERLREYVSAAVSAAPTPPPVPEKPPAKETVPTPKPDVTPPALAIESDDDDYTVEEVFKSAAEKVKENQIQKEMEVVKKFINESPKDPEPDVIEVPLTTKTVLKELSSSTNASAANVLALMQASVQTTTRPSFVNSTATNKPRLFGDKSEDRKTNIGLTTNVANLLAALSGNTNASNVANNQNKTNNANPVQADNVIQQINFNDATWESNQGGYRNDGMMGINNPPYPNDDVMMAGQLHQDYRSGATGENPQNFGNQGFNQPIYDNAPRIGGKIKSQSVYGDTSGLGNQPFIDSMNSEPMNNYDDHNTSYGNQEYSISYDGYGPQGSYPDNGTWDTPNNYEGDMVANRGGPNRGGLNRGGPDRGGSNRGVPDRGGFNRGGQTRGGSYRGGPDRGGSNRGGADRGGSNRGGPDRGGSNRGGPDRGGSNRGGSDRGGSNRGSFSNNGPYNNDYNMADNSEPSNVYGGGNIGGNYPQDQYANSNRGIGERGGFNRGGNANRRGNAGGGGRARGSRGRGRGNVY